MGDTRGHDSDPTESHEPLIAHENDDSTEEHGNGETERRLGDDGKDTGRSLWILTLSAGISGLLFGYE